MQLHVDPQPDRFSPITLPRVATAYRDSASLRPQTNMAQFKICVINPGVVHSLSRTLAFAPHFAEIHYVDCSGIDKKEILNRHGIYYYGPNDFAERGSRFLGFRAFLRRMQPDAIVCHYAGNDFFYHAIGNNDCPVAALAMGTDIQYEQGDTYVPAFRRLLTRLAIRSCVYISANSQGLAKRIVEYGYQGMLDVNLWGADLGHFYPRSRSTCRERFGLEMESAVILSPRAVSPLYNTELIVKACATLKKRYKNLVLLILGRTQSAYRDTIERLISELDLQDCTRLIYEVSQNDLPDYYCTADVVVSLARTEGFPITVLETMACRVPNVVSKIPPIEAVLTDRVHARLTPLDYTSLTHAIDAILSDPSGTRSMVRNAYDFAVGAADIKVNGERFARQLHDCIKKHDAKKMGLLQSLVFNFLFVTYSLMRKLGVA